MKFIAATDFHNAPELNMKLDEKTPGFKGSNVIHKGYEFELAPGVKSLKSVDNANLRQTISKLVLYGFAIPVDDTDESKDAISALNKQLANDKSAAAKSKKAADDAADAPTLAEQIAIGVAQALAQLGITPKKA